MGKQLAIRTASGQTLGSRSRRAILTGYRKQCPGSQAEPMKNGAHKRNTKKMFFPFILISSPMSSGLMTFLLMGFKTMKWIQSRNSYISCKAVTVARGKLINL
jgi:hypothetical protein